MKRFLLFVLALAALLAACTYSAKPKVISHDLPALEEVDVTWLDEAGCPASDNPSSQILRECQAGSYLYEMGCKQVRILYLLGGLSFPVVECIAGDTYDQEMFLDESFSFEGCLFGYYHTYILFRDGKYEAINSRQAFQQAFAPIESEEEALSYAILYMDYNVGYVGGYFSDNLRYHTRVIEEPYVKTTEEGFLVHLFTPPKPLCGCGQHTVYSVDLIVKPNGQIIARNYKPLYSFEACLD